MTALRILILVAGGLALGGCYAEGSAGARPGYGGGYVQNSQPGYVSGGVAPAQTVYAQPVNQGYNQPAQPMYNQQAQPVYGQPVQQGYGRPACPQCVPGSAEVCDGCDNNCNGVIDEGC